MSEMYAKTNFNYLKVYPRTNSNDYYQGGRKFMQRNEMEWTVSEMKIDIVEWNWATAIFFFQCYCIESSLKWNKNYPMITIVGKGGWCTLKYIEFVYSDRFTLTSFPY